MELTAEQLNELERYLTGEMMDNEVSKYESEIANNIALQQHLEELGSLDEVLMDEGWMPTEFDANNEKAKDYFDYMLDEENQAFYKELENIDVAIPKQQIKPPKKSLYRRLSGIAAVLAIGLLTFTFWPKNVSSDKFYAKYANPSDLPSLVQKNDSGTELSKAEKAFNNKEYEAAIPIFEYYLSQNQEDDLVRMYYAFALEKEGKLSQATTQMELIAFNDNSLRQADGQYYFSLMILKQGNKELAITNLEKIPSDHPKYAFAQKVLKKIK